MGSAEGERQAAFRSDSRSRAKLSEASLGDEEEEEEEGLAEAWLEWVGWGLARSRRGMGTSMGMRTKERWGPSWTGAPAGVSQEEEEALAGQGWKNQCHCWQRPHG